MKLPTQPLDGLGSKANSLTPHSLLKHLMLAEYCERPRFYIDFVRLIFKLPNTHNINFVEAISKRPTEWSASSIQITLAGEDIPHALNPCSGSSNYFALTVQEPHRYPFAVDQLPSFLAKFDAKLCPEYCVAEFGFELHPKALERAVIQSDAQGLKQFKESSGDFLARLTSHLKHLDKFDAASARIFHPYPLGEPKKSKAYNIIPCKTGWVSLVHHGVQGAEQGGAAIAASMSLADRNCTFYIGNKPSKQVTGKAGARKQTWLANTLVKAYHKVTDRALELPPNEHHFRIEVTTACQPAAGESFNLDPMELLNGSTSCASTMARFFSAECWDNGLLEAIRQRWGFSQPETHPDFKLLIDGKEITVAKLRQKFKREGRGSINIPSFRPDSAWNQAMTNGFIGMCAKMRRAQKCAGFTFTPPLPSTSKSASGPEHTYAEPQRSKTVPTEGKAQSFNTPSRLAEIKLSGLSPDSAAEGALITTPTYTPSGGVGVEELYRLIDELEAEQASRQ